MPIVF
ncbi:uncharacterized protein FFMR_11812 [Fusarium fujikuroi]